MGIAHCTLHGNPNKIGKIRNMNWWPETPLEENLARSVNCTEETDCRSVDCKVSRIPRTVRLARKGIYIIYGPWLCFRDLPCHFLRSPCGLLEHGDRGDGRSSRMFYIFLSRRRSGFSSGSKLRLLSLQWCNPSSNLDTFYGGQQWWPSYLLYCLCPSTQIHRSAMCRSGKIVCSNVTHNCIHQGEDRRRAPAWNMEAVRDPGCDV